jgi:tetratricopeptide (TPR) repeat protein
MGNLSYRQGDYEKAEELYRRSIVIKETILGRQHPGNVLPHYAITHFFPFTNVNNVTYLLIHLKLIGAADIAEYMHTLAYLYTTQGKYEDAKVLYEKAFAILLQTFGMVPFTPFGGSVGKPFASHFVFFSSLFPFLRIIR